jgi:hypothetical protein
MARLCFRTAAASAALGSAAGRAFCCGTIEHLRSAQRSIFAVGALLFGRARRSAEARAVARRPRPGLQSACAAIVAPRGTPLAALACRRFRGKGSPPPYRQYAASAINAAAASAESAD